MITRTEMIALRRQRLATECKLQRIDLLHQTQALERKLDSLQVGLRILERCRRHPEWIAGLALGLALFTPRRLSLCLQAGSAGLRTWRSLKPALQRLLSRS
ncbi:MAG TPA: YqjK family protein [Noviherbaspirillum sp.]|nr:YqjK family protein [Noviherbaspirillum sp.]